MKKRKLIITTISAVLGGGLFLAALSGCVKHVDPEPEPPVHVHVPGDTVTENIVDPTCETTGGYDEVVYCIECEEEISREHITTDALGHKWDDGVITVQPTFDDPGEILYTCERDETHTKTEVLDPIPVKFTITVKDNSSSETIRTIRVAEDGEYTLSPESKAGYDFVCFLDEDGNEFPATGVIDESKTVFASFELQDTDTVEKLEAAAAGGADRIIVSKSLTIDRPIYFYGNTKLTASDNITLTRAVEYAGDMFVVGTNAEGNNPIVDNYVPELFIGNEEGTSGTITIDGNKENVTVDVVGSAIYAKNGATVHMYDGVSIINCHKVGNERTLTEEAFSSPYVIGGSAVLLVQSSFTMHGGLFDNNSVNMTNLQPDSEQPDYMVSTRGGAVYVSGEFRMIDGTFSNNEGYYGGAIADGTILRVDRGQFLNNKAVIGGAIHSAGTSSADLYIGYSDEDVTEPLVVFDGNEASSKAGVLDSSTLSPVICNHVKFVNNKATGKTANGGAIVTSGPLTVKDCIFDNNNCGYAGGAVYQYYSNSVYTSRFMTAINTTFENNLGRKGGAILLSAGSSAGDAGTNAIFEECVFDNNECEYLVSQSVDETDPENPVITETKSGGAGGAIFVSKNSNVEIKNCEFNENVSAAMGGAIVSNEGGHLDVSGCTFTSNHAGGDGGAISAYGGSTLAAKDDTFNSNLSDEYGGALYLAGIELTLDNINFDSNKAVSAGAIYLTGCTLNINKAIFTSNSTADDKGYGGAIYAKNSEIYINEQNANEVVFDGNIAYQNGGAIFCSTDANLYVTGASFKNNIATTVTGGAIYLTADSTSSFEGTAFEHNTAGSAAGAVNIGKNSVTSFNEVIFDSNTGTSGGAIHCSAGETYNFTNCEFISNVANGTGEENGFGGAIEATNLITLNFEGCLFENNTATKSGGAVYASYASVTATSTTFKNNSSDNHAGAVYFSSSTMFNFGEGVVFDGNTATGGNGGAIYMTRVKNDSTFDGVKFVDNTAKTHGGALFVHNSTINANNCIFGEIREETVDEVLTNVPHGNSVTNGFGGAIYVVQTGRLISENTTFVANSAKSGGAIYLSDGNEITLTNATFKENKASANGGAIGGTYTKEEGNATITVITDNSEDEEALSLFENNTSDTYGGAIYVTNKIVTNINGVTFKNNTATNADEGFGGAIAAVSSNELIVDNSLFDTNSCPHYAGALYVTSTVLDIKNNTTFIGNTAKYGGAIDIDTTSDISIVDSTFKNNEATNNTGGAIYFEKAKTSTVLDNLVFSGNNANTWGGCFYVHNSVVDVANCTFDIEGVGNTAKSGGAVAYVSTNGELTITNSTIAYQTTPGSGSAVYVTNTGSKFAAIGCSIHDNQATKNGGVFVIDGGVSLSLTNCKTYSNTAAGTNGGVLYALNGATVTIAKDTTIDESAESYFYDNEVTGYYGGALFLGADINATISGTEFKRNNAARGGAIYSTNATVDISSSVFEENVSTPKSSGTKHGVGGAIAVATGSTFTISGSTFTSNSTSGSSDTDFSIGSGGAIAVTGTGSATVHGSTFTGNSATRGGAISAMDTASLIVDESSIFTGNSATNHGGAIYTRGTDADNKTIVSVTSSAFSNSSTTASTSYGGAICTYTTNTTISGSTFNENSSYRGAALFVGEGAAVTVNNNSVFTSNTVSNRGGAIYVNANAGLVSISNSTFTSNHADGNGGAVAVQSGTTSAVNVLTFKNVTFTGNNATSIGGAAYFTHVAEATFEDCTFDSNTAPTGGAIYAGNYAVTLTFKNIIATNNTASAESKGHFASCGAAATVKTNKNYFEYNGAAAGATELSTIFKGSATIEVID